MRNWIMMLLVLAAGATVPPALSAQEKLKVTTLSTVLTDLARNVGGDRVEVVAMVKPGTDPHAFNPTAAQLRQMTASRVILASGKGMEPYLDKLADLAKGKAALVDVGAGVPSLRMEAGACGGDHGHHHHHHHGESADGTVEDPHWWHDIDNMKRAAVIVRDAFIRAMPSAREHFTARTAAYLKELDGLKAWSDRKIAELPRGSRKLVTSHDALQYFARANSFEILAIEGISTKEQASSKKVAEIIARIREGGVKAVFAEFSHNPKVQEQIRKETGARFGGVLYADGLGTGDASTYVGMYRHNVSTIVDALK